MSAEYVSAEPINRYGFVSILKGQAGNLGPGR